MKGAKRAGLCQIRERTAVMTRKDQIKNETAEKTAGKEKEVVTK